MLRLYTHSACLQHDPGPGHVERPVRLRAVLHALDCDQFRAVDRIESPQATREQLRRVHDARYIEYILSSTPADGAVYPLDADTVMSAGSADAALHAAGATVAAVDAVLGGSVQRVFCAVRPPGHHATANQAMGFCLFNNVAVAAAHALAAHGLERVAIADFDVHHGNGTQAIFEHESRVMFASSHQSPLYPGTGAEHEHGAGNIVNATLRPGAGSGEFRDAWSRVLLPRLHDFRPQLLLISAGFDAHADDPLADIQLDRDDYSWITERLVALAREHADGRIVSSLEGGYNLAALASCARAHVSALME